jgi:hypothetical protein
MRPPLRPLFKGEMAEQGRKLMTMIGTAVANLHQLQTRQQHWLTHPG